MSKYKDVFKEMLEYNKEVFDDFQKIHEQYARDPHKYQELFNEQGEQILRIIRRYENILCGRSESGRYGKFSTSLSDKFWQEIRRLFPQIDKVGNFS